MLLRADYILSSFLFCILHYKPLKARILLKCYYLLQHACLEGYIVLVVCHKIELFIFSGVVALTKKQLDHRVDGGSGGAGVPLAAQRADPGLPDS